MNTNICLNCKHWQSNQPISPIEPLRPFEYEWRDGVCEKLSEILSIEMHCAKEDGIIGERDTGLRGFAGLLAGIAYGSKIPLEHIGIRNPRIAPSEGHMEVWEHFGITVESLVTAIQNL